MVRKVLSARGQVVDFDLLKIKSQILKTPTNENARNRERFIDKKRRRAVRKSADQMMAQVEPPMPKSPPAQPQAAAPVDAPPPTDVQPNVEPTVPVDTAAPAVDMSTVAKIIKK